MKQQEETMNTELTENQMNVVRLENGDFECRGFCKEFPVQIVAKEDMPGILAAIERHWGTCN
jgi:hypothetical protein